LFPRWSKFFFFMKLLLYGISKCPFHLQPKGHSCLNGLNLLLLHVSLSKLMCHFPLLIFSLSVFSMFYYLVC
jgi:hypothetical protein